MKLLLDTHIVIWSFVALDRLERSIADMIADPHNDVAVSTISIWEIGIKHSLGRGQVPPFGSDEAIRNCEDAGYRLIDVTPREASIASKLAPLHGDPFDRLLAAQAIDGPFRLVTRDSRLAAYGDFVILAR